MTKPTPKLDREAVRERLVLMLLALDVPGDDCVRTLLPTLTRLLQQPATR